MTDLGIYLDALLWNLHRLLANVGYRVTADFARADFLHSQSVAGPGAIVTASSASS